MMSIAEILKGTGLERRQCRWQHGDPLVGLWRQHIAAGFRQSGDRRDDRADSCLFSR